MSPATSTNPTVNLVAKSQLARLLATENMNIEHSHTATTASFDTNSRRLILPIWSKASEDLYDMLVAHEVGHALITPREDVYMPVCKAMSPSNPNQYFPYLNIVEDIRVDNTIKDRYPGVRRSYFNAFKELMQRDFFGIAKYGNDLSDLSFGDRLNIYSKVGHLGFVDVSFTDEERVVVDEAMKVESFDDVCAVAEKVWNMSKKRKDNQPTDQGSDSAKGNGKGDQDANDGGAGDQSQDGQDQSQGQSPMGSQGGDQQSPSGDQGQGSQGGEQNTNNSPTSQNGKSGKASNSSSTAAPQTGDLKTVDTLAKGLAGLTDTNKYNGYAYYDMPRLNLDNIVFPYKKVMQDLSPMRDETANFCGDKIFAKIQDRNKDFVSNLVKQFEQKMAADECRRTRTAKSGQLDMRKISSYKFNDDLFIKNQITSDGKSHGMVFIMDWSGSMGDYLLPTIEQLLALCMFCRKMNIPFEVYAFTNSMPNVDDYYSVGNMTQEKYHEMLAIKGNCSPDYTVKTGNSYYGANLKTIDTGRFLSIQNFGMIQFLSSKMNTKEFKDAAELLCQCGRNNDHSGSDLRQIGSYTQMDRKYGLSSTPLNEAIYAGIEIVSRFKVANRLDIVNTVVLTDGEPTSSTNPRNSANPFAKNAILNLPNRKQMPLSNDKMHATTAEMLGLAEVFREITGTNLISIRLCGPRDGSYLATMCGTNEKEVARMTKEWKEQDFFSYSSYGFTESFVINSKTEVMDDDDILGNVKDDASIATITRAFIKGNAKKATSRVLLNRFSDLIAKKILA